MRSNNKSASVIANILVKKIDKPENVEGDEEQEQQERYMYRAVGSQKRTIFSATMCEITFELLGMSAGYFLRIESAQPPISADK